jgi:tRNA-specific adenosine deaminase 2
MDELSGKTSADSAFMDMALVEARDALLRGEVPIGCVLVGKTGVVVARGSNRTTERGNATAHAELVAFEALSEPVLAKSLTLYVTCEPCIMCAAAIVQVACVRRVVFGCENPRFGGCGTVRSLSMYENHRRALPASSGQECLDLPEVVSGLKGTEAVQLLTEFYLNTNPNAPVPKKKRRRRNEEQKSCSSTMSV